MNPYLAVILVILLARYLLDLVSDLLNVRHFSPDLPTEFHGYYDAEKYALSQRYLADNVRFGILQDAVFTVLAILFILLGGFNLADTLARSAGLPALWTGLLFTGILVLALRIVEIPFSLYSTFRIEEKYGFNKTTPRTFVLDFLKELLLTVVIGGAVFLAVVWFFDRTGSMAWVYCWAAVVSFQVFLLFIAPYVIMPLFNKFTPIEEGELQAAIAAYAKAQDFRMEGVFKMDGSKRSSKSNAFFTGFGRTRRLVLLDTLIDKHTVPELLAVVAHEMGHYKKRHVPWAIVRGAASAGIAFFLLSLFIGNERLFEAFRMEHVSIYAGLIFFGFLYTPIAMALGIVENRISRAQEFMADAYAVQTTGDPDAMVSGLKKLGVDNLANLTPHPLKVFLSYSHPPLLSRIAAIRQRPLPE
ncbi:MAG: M48 family metallopeptidase [Lentisphaerae bacterium]|nr:M48 family metallopeptidase [Lentisphaerota bacterium]